MANQMASSRDKTSRIQIGNLAWSATEAPLRALFLAYGQIASYERPRDALTKRPGAFAYMEMASADAGKAIKALNGHQLGDQALSVSVAKQLAP